MLTSNNKIWWSADFILINFMSILIWLTYAYTIFFYVFVFYFILILLSVFWMNLAFIFYVYALKLVFKLTQYYPEQKTFFLYKRSNLMWSNFYNRFIKRSPLLPFEFENPLNLIRNTLVKSWNSQCILAGSKPQKSYFLSFDWKYMYSFFSYLLNMVSSLSI